MLVGHGSTLNAESSGPIRQHANALRQTRLFAEVREAFWKQDPQIVDVVSGLEHRRTFIVPVFISEGYFSEQVIPAALGFAIAPSVLASRVKTASDGKRIFYCKPLGSHPAMTEVLLARASEILRQFPFPRAPKLTEVTLFIAGHGTLQNDNSRKAIEAQVELIRSRGIFHAVHPVFMEERPTIAECYELAPTRNIVVVPFFISDGLHVREDIPVLLGEPERLVQQRLKAGQPTWRNPTEKHDKRVWYTDSVGTEPLVRDVILERVHEAATW